METNKTVLLIDTHLTYPNWSEGKLNKAFIEAARLFFISQGYTVTQTKVEEGYDVQEEVAKHLAADIVILQTPVNWFGAPWIYKKYVDEVFNNGLQTQKFLTGDGRTRDNPKKQYGTGGLLAGKKMMVSATWNAPREAFDDPTQLLFKGMSTDDFFLPITSNYLFCGYEILPGFNCFDIFKAGDPAGDLQKYPSHLTRALAL